VHTFVSNVDCVVCWVVCEIGWEGIGVIVCDKFIEACDWVDMICDAVSS
jgi:hypothetical protein